MKLITSIFAVISVCAFGSTLEVLEPSSVGWFIPQINGDFRWVTKEEYEYEISLIEPRAVTVNFYLYTKSNPSSGQKITLNDAKSLSSSNFNKKNPTRFIIHGWNNNYQSDVNVVLRNAYLAAGSYNVFCVDWGSHAQNPNYSSARNIVPSIGEAVASFMDFLNSSGDMPFSTLGVAGHSLGAHVSGFSGKYVKRGKINTIHGLDPALPGFDYNNCKTRLCSTDATYVESIHTNGGTLGFLAPIGTSSFYPNGGKKQPGCGVDLAGSCSHGRSYMYLAESIRSNSFPSMKCSNYEAAVDSNCGSTYSSVRMGSSSNIATSGHYYVPVKSASPYGYGA